MGNGKNDMQPLFSIYIDRESRDAFIMEKGRHDESSVLIFTSVEQTKKYINMNIDEKHRPNLFVDECNIENFRLFQKQMKGHREGERRIYLDIYD